MRDPKEAARLVKKLNEVNKALEIEFNYETTTRYEIKDGVIYSTWTSPTLTHTSITNEEWLEGLLRMAYSMQKTLRADKKSKK